MFFVRSGLCQQIIDLRKDRLGLLGHASIRCGHLTCEVNHIAKGDDLTHAGAGMITFERVMERVLSDGGESEADGHDKCHSDDE